jgi:hypothetical protein
MSLTRRIELFLKATNMAPTRFGRLAAGDPRLVFDLRRGREPGAHLSARVVHFIMSQEQ